jgi:E3 ubiquitin-protein ligase DOA10
LLQKEMARQMLALSNSSKEMVDQDWENECVICMEGFDPTNPRMPTLCGCGANKTYFHLPCLYQWLEQSRECPSCRAPITWQEF